MKRSPKSTQQMTGREFYDAPLARRMAFLARVRKLARFIVTDCGALNLHSHGSDNKDVLALVATLEGPECAFGLVMHALEDSDGISDEALRKIEPVVLDAMTLRTATAYMLGLAVGQQIGAQSFEAVTR